MLCDYHMFSHEVIITNSIIINNENILFGIKVNGDLKNIYIYEKLLELLF